MKPTKRQIKIVEHFIKKTCLQERQRLTENITHREFESHVNSNQRQILQNMKTYGFNKKDIKKIRNYYDFANVTGIDSRDVKGIDLQFYTDQLYSLLFEN